MAKNLKTKDMFMNKLNNITESRKKVEVVEIPLINSSLIKKIDFTQNLELDNFLFEKSLELMNVQAKSSIALGKIFKEVQEKIETRTFGKWLEANGYDRMAASRHKRRYELYDRVHESKKAFIVFLSVREIDYIYKGDFQNYVNLINGTETIEELKGTLHGEMHPQIIAIHPEREERVDFGEIFYKFSKIKFEDVDSRKKAKLEKYLKKIEDILNQ
ncbi:MAG: hypothetical protein ACRCR2_08535 [Fusobacteriaceae bacterium]